MLQKCLTITKVELVYEKSSTKEGSQPNLCQPSIKNAKMEQFWKDYENRGFSFVAKKYTDAGFKGAMKRCAKKVLKTLGLLDAVKALLEK